MMRLEIRVPGARSESAFPSGFGAALTLRARADYRPGTGHGWNRAR